MSDRVTAMDIEKQRFRRKFRGFDEEDVRMYLRSVAEEVERLNLENAKLHEQLGELNRGLDEREARACALQDTLISAQEMAGDLKQRAQAQADLVVDEARLQAERLLHDAREQLGGIEAEISRAKLERDLFEQRLRATVEEHLTVLDQRHADGRAPDNVRVLHPRSGSEAG